MTELQSPLAKNLTLPCGLILPNRLAKAAMTEGLSDAYGRPTQKLCRLYEKWSEGGAGLLVSGNVQVDRRYIERPGNVCIDGPQSDEQIEMLKALARAGQSHGSKIFIQLSHAGRQSNGMINLNPVGPGNIRLNLPKSVFGTPRALLLNEIAEVKQQFVDAAKVCKECGFDGVQIHSAHGYLLSSFLNPLANNRDELFGAEDPYGGSLINRARLLLEIVREVRHAVGPSFAISVKLNSADFQEGGFAAEEAVQVAVMLEKAEVDLLEISGGNYEAGIYKEAVDRAESRQKASTRRREAYFLEYALNIKAAVKRIPVMVTGGWRVRTSMESAIAENECALIGLGRPLCGDVFGPKKLLDRSIESLPCYESTLQTFHWTMQWVFWIPLQLVGAINMLAQQGWYYRNMVSIAETGEPALDNGCFASLLANADHEKKWVLAMQGEVACNGSIHKGLPE